MASRMNRESTMCWVALAWALAPSAPTMAGQPAPVSDAMIVNEVTVGRQLNGALVARGNGEVAVVWEGEDADGRGVFGRIVDAAGQPTGPEFPVSVLADGTQASAEIEATASGGFLVVWENDLPSETSISSRSFDSAGVASPVIDLAMVQDNVNVQDPSVTRLSDGTFVVSWDEYQSDMNNGSVRARFLDASGGLTGSAFTLSTDGTDSNVFGPEIGDRPGDGFVVHWDYNGGPAGLWGQAFTDDATPEGVPVLITDGGNNYYQVVGMADGGWLSVWSSASSRAMRRRFDSAGVPSAPVGLSPAPGLQQWTDVAALPGDRVVVTWLTLLTGEPRRIDAQLIRADASVEAEWTVAETTATLHGSRVAYDAATNQVVFLWSERGVPGGDQEEVMMRRYQLDGPLFADGFESGDLSAWSSTTRSP